MGSVKDLTIIKEAKGNSAGIGRFIFSDRYSVFDWGEMPNHISNKGKALCIIGAYFFEKLEKMGIKTHYRGIVEDNKLKRLMETKKPANIMEVKLLRVIEPQIKDNTYDYSIYQNEKSNFLIPLEIIYRNYLPEGSSIFKRLKKGDITLEDLGFDKVPSPDEKLKKTILDVSTKLESTDRYIKWEEAQNILNLSDKMIEKIKKITLLVNDLITRETEKLSLINEDGKLEFGLDENRNLILVDVLGTPDECRFKFNNIPVSKEVARIFYRKTDWFKEVEEAKKKDSVGWKKIVKSSPPPLPQRLNELISMLYQAFCNEITERKWFETPSLKEILNEINDIL